MGTPVICGQSADSRWQQTLWGRAPRTAEALAQAEQDLVRIGDAQLEAFGDPARALHEMGCGDRRADFDRGLLEQGQPAVEMGRVDGQGQVLRIGRP